MVYAYLRVSTNQQTLDNQRYGIKEYCKQHNLKIDAWFEEKISGLKKANEREFGELLKYIKKEDTIIVTEISRIGRSVIDVLNSIKLIRERGCILIAIKQNFILDDSLNSKIIGYVFSIVAEIERELLSARVKEGLAARKQAGIKLGRPVGSKNKVMKLDRQKDFIEMCLQTGKSRYYIKKKLKVHNITLNNYLKISGLATKYNIIFNP